VGRSRPTPYLLLAVLMLGTALGLGLGLTEAPSASTHQTNRPNGVATPHKSPSAAPLVAVPDVLGLSLAVAEGTLSAAGFEFIVTNIPGSVVVTEEPVAGSLLAKGSVVSLSMSP
jgi:hypothetical protein